MPEQALLFDLHPEGTEPPIPQRRITQGCLLPFPVNQEIDAARTGSILCVSNVTVLKFIRQGYISGYQLSGRGAKEPWRISYNSIVELCDHLRLHYHIRDRRPKLASGRRWRDADLLPFPKLDTVGVKEVMTGLNLTIKPALRLLEEGAFEAYRLTPEGAWRVSKSSLYAYRDRKKAEIQLRKSRFVSRRSGRSI